MILPAEITDTVARVISKQRSCCICTEHSCTVCIMAAIEVIDAYESAKAQYSGRQILASLEKHIFTKRDV